MNERKSSWIPVKGMFHSRTGDPYWLRSRSAALSILAIAPLAVLYEVGLAVTNAPVVNGAELLLHQVFWIGGPTYGPIAWRVALALVFVASAVVVLRGHFKLPGDLLGIVAEGLVFGILLGPTAYWLQSKISAFLSIQAESRSLGMQLALSLGAGVYEEILFRLIVLSAIYSGISRASVVGSHPVFGASAAVVASALLFSAFHHVPGGEPFAAPVFFYRAIAGVVLGVLFIARGLGVAVYTHTAYDVLVTLLR